MGNELGAAEIDLGMYLMSYKMAQLFASVLYALGRQVDNALSHKQGK